MLDESLMQLMEASRTVPIYTRQEGERGVVVNAGHYACGPECTVPMATDRTYWTSVVKAEANDGCEAYAGVVWAQQDRAWREVMRGTLAYGIYRTRGLTETYGGETLEEREWLDSEIYVRLTAEENADEATHRNHKTTLRELFAGFMVNHTAFRRIKVVTYGMRNAYFDPTIPFNVLQQSTMGTHRDLLPYLCTWDERYIPRGLRQSAVELVRMQAGDAGGVEAAQEPAEDRLQGLRPLVNAGAGRRTAMQQALAADVREQAAAYVTNDTTVNQTMWRATRRPNVPRPTYDWQEVPEDDELLEIEMEDM